MKKVTIVTVPGFHGSGETHWQTWLENQFDNVYRVTDIDWSAPQFFIWVNALERFIDQIPGPVILVAHSFGALVSARVAEWRSDKVKGFILVAPASPERFSLTGPRKANEPSIAEFLPDQHIDSLGLLIGSESVHWLSFEAAKKLSHQWGIAFYNAGQAGHINIESGYGQWPLLKEFVEAMAEAIEPIPGDEIFHLGSWNRNRRAMNTPSDSANLNHAYLAYT